jgi:hypothetical protein
MTVVIPDPGDSNKTPRGHEPDGVAVRWMEMIGLGLLGLVIVTIVMLAVAFRMFVPNVRATPDELARLEKLAPGVKPNQAYDRQRIQDAERETLNHYGWQNQKKDIVRIPIERAIELMAERKLRVDWPKEEQANIRAPKVIPNGEEPK